MTNKLTLAIALFAGFGGGMLTRYIAPPPVFAQASTAPAQAANEIRARSFILVDQSGNAAGTFTAEPGGSPAVGSDGRWSTTTLRIVLRNAGGHEIWSAGGSAIRPLNAVVR